MLALMQITKECVDSFETGREIPSCQIRAEWTEQGQPSQLVHAMTLKGARTPKNYFLIELDSTPPDTTGSEFMCWHKPSCTGGCFPLLHHSVVNSNALTRISALL